MKKYFFAGYSQKEEKFEFNWVGRTGGTFKEWREIKAVPPSGWVLSSALFQMAGKGRSTSDIQRPTFNAQRSKFNVQCSKFDAHCFLVRLPLHPPPE
jgi:hypothetical protein